MNDDLQERDDALNLKLQMLVEEVKQHSASNDNSSIRIQRRIALNKLVNAIQSSGKLSRQTKWLGLSNYEDYYNEALQLTLMEVCQKIEQYNPQYPVMAWVNTIFSRRFNDLFKKKQKQGLTQVPRNQEIAPILSIDEINRGIPASNEISEVEQIKEIIQEDPENFLQKQQLQGYYQANLQLILLMRLAQKPWKEISQELGVPTSTISSFYQRRMHKIIAYIQKYI